MGFQCRFSGPIGMLGRKHCKFVCHGHSGVGLAAIDSHRQVMPYAGLQFMTFDQWLVDGLWILANVHRENQLFFR